MRIVIFVLLTVFIVVDGSRTDVVVSEFDAMRAAAATFLDIGPGFGVAGPYDTYANFPQTTRVAMIVLMWVGRIEIIPGLVFFTRAFWTS